MRYKIVLSPLGKQVFKGGNIEVIKKMLISFEAKNDKDADNFYYKKLRETLGTGSDPLYILISEKTNKEI